MRAILSKAVAVSLIAGAGLAVSACNTETATTVNNTTTVVDETGNVGVSDDMTGAADGAVGNGTLDNAVDANATVGNAM